MSRARRLAGVGVAFALTACGGGAEEAIFCPRVDAVAGLDRLAIAYEGAGAPVPTALDVVDATCVEEDGDLVVGTVLEIRLGPERPPGEVRVPYTIAVDTPDETRGSRAEIAVVPPGAAGVYEYHAHRFAGLAGRDDVRIRLLVALVPDEAERERLAAERPRP